MAEDNDQTTFDHKTFLKNLTHKPGVYQMLDDTGEVIYVGKAKNLKNRVSSYFNSRGLTNKTVSLVSRIHQIDVTVTASEVEALILEQNLIKQYRPKYNILLRDDKSYPYILLTDQEYPRLGYHRGTKRAKGKYYGPYPNASSVRESMALLQRVFKVRQCEDSYFRNRSRPCLQYQIKRCSGPCVGMVSQQEYDEQVKHTRLFLEGKNKELIKELADNMEKASETLEFEQAAEYRDQIQHLQKVTETQFIESGEDNVDVHAIAQSAGAVCIHVLFVRSGRILGSKSYYPKAAAYESEGELLEAFLSQFYFGGSHRDMPKRIVTSTSLPNKTMLAEAFNSEHRRKIQLNDKVRGRTAQWLSLAETTALQNLQSRLSHKATIKKKLDAMKEKLELDEVPGRLECFDISHSSGEATTASCVVFDENGPLKSDYRKFNIEGIKAGDDYAAMHQALERRFKRVASGESKCPDVLLIDGGKGQVTQAAEVMSELGLSDVVIIGVAKGPTRRAGLETLILNHKGKEIDLPGDSPVLHLIQQVRDESHRFAVKAHTARRDKARIKSQLDDVPGVGAKRRRELLRYFGSAKGVMEAPVRELVKVDGISERIAEDIYAYFHKD